MLFSKKKNNQMELPAVLSQPENPVNYDSVLDYLVGLSKTEYDKMLKVSGIYRNANKEAAKVLGVKDEPTTKLAEEKPTDDQMEEALDTILDAPLDTEFLLDDEPKQVDIVKLLRDARVTSDLNTTPRVVILKDHTQATNAALRQLKKGRK